ncbi:DUF3747 domain-containing protein [Synechococcus sp. RedBA-s]|uniref:DUF3747 domain-containing protein n=1 Tax=Synechococcus sp. RedBA-s TaxID=2823741 RepID=UPI0020CF297C|nr:DUF3747 domain-containing protein [Synechococcus sp. RedBA-s]
MLERMKSTMQRTYLALAGAGLAATTLQAVTTPLAEAAGVFDSQSVEASRFAVLAKPVGFADWSLLLIEQAANGQPCWQARPDGLVDASMNRFDSKEICTSYAGSNAYSLRVAGQDLASRYRLRLSQVGNELQLQAMTPSDTTLLLLGRGQVNRRDPEGFVPIKLESDWQLNRRVFGQQTLKHIYFVASTPLGQLIAQAGGGNQQAQPSGGGAPGSLGRALGSLARGGELPSGPVALQVIPFRE